MTSAHNCEDIELTQNTFLNKILHDISSSSIQVFSNNTALHCGKPGRRTCMFSYEPFTAILEVPEVSPEVVWLLWVVGEALGTTSAPLKAQKPAKTS